MNARRTKMLLPALNTGLGLALWAMVLVIAQPAQLYGRIYPNEYYQGWNFDADTNRIDDRLEEMDPGEIVDAAVLFKRCLTDEDATFVGGYATIAYVGHYVQGIWVTDVPVSTLLDMLSDPYGDSLIFRIEQAQEGEYALDVSCRAVKARQSTTYAGSAAWEYGYTGDGIVIAILDSGVDDDHPAFAGKDIDGYDAEMVLETNPDDSLGHGTHVAGIALGVDPDGTYIGVARDADLVDVNVGRASPTSIAHQTAMDWCIAHRDSLSIDVLNLSYHVGFSCNGKCADCMAVDAAVDKGLVVCVSVGNNGKVGWIPSPGAADRAITVGAIDDAGTVPRDDDTFWPSSNAGPRATDGDDDTIDEEKPDVVAPGVDIMAPKGTETTEIPPNDYQNNTGTSMACPHAAGVAAIMLSAKPGLTPDDVKALLRTTSSDSNLNVNPGWAATWGNGNVDAYEALRRDALAADIYINSWIGDIYVSSQIRAGQPVQLNAKVHNSGPNNADEVIVIFFANCNNLGFSGWTRIGETVLFNISGSDSATATVTWTPLLKDQVVRVRAVYGGDTNLNNNQGDENFLLQPHITSAETGSPYPVPREFHLVVDASDIPAEEGWTATVSSEEGLFDTLWIDTRDVFDIFYDITDDCCPRMVNIEIECPPTAPPGQFGELTLEGWVDGQMVGRQPFRTYSPCDCGEEFGDLTCDAALNPLDVVYIVNYVYKLDDRRCHNAGWDCPYDLGDVNCDDHVNPLDVVHYVVYVYKNLTPFPCNGCP